MKIVYRFSSNLVVILIVALTFVPNLHAMKSENVFQSELGISLDGNYSNEELLSVKSGTVIQGIVFDPSKMGGCVAGDKVELTNIEPEVWQIKHWRTGQIIIAGTVKEKENLKIKKVGSTQSLSYKENYSKSNSVMIKLGAYLPNNDIEDVDNGFYNQITYNRYLNKNFALEVGGGSFFTSAEGVFKDSSNNEITVSGDLYVYNIIFNLKAIFPLPFGEIYAGIGPGLYLIYGDDDETITFVDDNDTVFGGQAVAGINFDVSEVVFLGFEGQYIFTDDAEFTSGTYSKNFNIDGYNISGVIGFKFKEKWVFHKI